MNGSEKDLLSIPVKSETSVNKFEGIYMFDTNEYCVNSRVALLVNNSMKCAVMMNSLQQAQTDLNEAATCQYLCNTGSALYAHPGRKIPDKKRNGLWAKIILILLLLFFNIVSTLDAQEPNIAGSEFFVDDRLIEVTLVSDFRKLIREKLKKEYSGNYQPATITMVFPDSVKVTENIEIRSRGKFRREKCNMPPVMLKFKSPNVASLNKLGTLKLVWPCGTAPYDEQLVLKEYLIYKIYNLLTEKSFRVRLVKIGYRDINDKMKPYTSYAYLMEDVDALARRNNCVEIQPERIRSEQTNRDQTTLMTLFEYMIGNSDWVIAISRNVKLIRSKVDSLSAPFTVPYDFDYSGLVNARYAIPPLELPISSVRERYYLGFTRTLEELQAALNIIRKQKAAIDSLIMNFAPLESFHKKDMSKYINDFFDRAEKDKDIKELFINNARRE